MTMAYVERCLADNVIHSEIFFDPQTHTERGVPIGDGRGRASSARSPTREKRGMTSKLILCFLRHLSEEDALATFEEARPSVRAVQASPDRRGTRFVGARPSAVEVRARVREGA